ncbi:MAG: AAA family ATPase [Bacteroidetes bacterium]|nr:AAA family ATPase [Bacteroidota bacterium]
MTESLFFKEMRVDRMYGSNFDLSLSDLSAHLNIVFGPNGAGKTTIANALNGLLLPSAGRAVHLHATADLCFGNQTLHVDVQDRRAECRIGGKTVDRSELSQFLRPKSYHLSLQELLPEVTGDGDLAQEIIRQANGGFDIAKAGKELAFSLQKRYNRTTEAKEFESANDKLRRIQREQHHLQDQKNQRANIQSDLDVSRQAAERVTAIEKIRKWQIADAKYQEAVAIVEAYPAAIRSSHDLTDIVSKTQELASALAQLKRDVGVQREAIESTQEKLDQNRLSPNGLEPGELQLLDSHTRDCSEQSRELEKLNETREATKEQAREAWENLGGHTEHGWDPAFTQEDLRHLQKYAKDFGSHIHEKQSLKSLKTLLEATDRKGAGMNSDELRDAQQILVQWILALNEDFPQRQNVRTLLLIIIILSTVLSLGAGFFLHPTGFSGLLVSVLTFWIYTLLHSNKQPRIAPTQIDKLKRLLPGLSQKSDLDSLRSGLNQLIEIRSKVQLDELKSNEGLRTERSLENLAEREPELETRKQELVSSLHLDDPPSDITSLIEFVDRILNWRKLDRKAKELTTECNITSERYGTLLKTTGDLFAKHGYDRPTDPRDAERLLDELRHDNDAAKRDSDRLAQEKRAWETTLSQLKDQESRHTKVFTDLELDIGDLAGLASRARQFAEWTKANAHANELRIRSESLHRDLPDEHQSLLEAENLEDELMLAQQESEKEKDLQERLTRLDAEIERAEADNSLENALAEKENKRIALESVREEKTAKAVGQAILDTLRENAIKNAPLVFQRAQENFQQVTDHRYTLKIPQNESFIAQDNQRKRDFDLTELSSATRVQLLLSVRLAFVETQETNYRLPITLDETLANSDDERARAIIKTMVTLAEDRQIFYFTAQQDEVDKWGDFVPEHLLKVYSIG